MSEPHQKHPAHVVVYGIDLTKHVEDCTLTVDTAEHLEAACFVALSTIEEH